MVLGIFRGFKTPNFFACGDPNPSHGLSVVLQCLNLKKLVCGELLELDFYAKLYLKDVFTSVGTRSYYS